MPYIESKVSTAVNKAQETELKTRLGKIIELIPGKNESWLMLSFEPGCSLYFKGSNEVPCAFVRVKVFGKETPEAYENMTPAICELFEEVLGIPADHTYVVYEALTNWGWNGMNF